MAYSQLDIETARSQHNLPDDTDIVLDYATKGYYMASQSKQCLFWLGSMPVHEVTRSARPTVSPAHLCA